jgi:hypothetical protein
LSKPTASHIVCDRHETLVSAPLNAASGNGTDSTVHVDPFQLSANGVALPADPVGLL